MKIKMKKIEKTDILIFLTVIIICLGAALAFYPGLMTSDNIDQLNQAVTGVYSDSHPILHTVIIGTIYKLFNNSIAVSIFQVIVFAVIWTYSCKVIRKENNTNLNKLFQIVLTIIICLIPVNFLYSITLWKDILYTYAILGVILYTYIGIKNNFNYNWIQMILVSLFLVLVMRVRHNGFPIGLVMFVIFLLANIVKNKKFKKSILFVGIFAITFAVLSIPKWTFKLKKTPSVAGTFISTKVYCMGALLNENIELQEDEYEFLNNILPVDEWKDNYDMYTGNPILFNSNVKLKYAKENAETFDSIFYKYAKKYPKTVLKHFISVNSMFWSVKEKGYMNAIVINNNSMEEHVLWKDEYKTESKSEILSSIYNKIIEKTSNNRVLYSLLYRPATLFYLTIIIILIIIFKTKKMSYILLIFPMGMNICTYIPFISSQDLRYAYPSFITCYFVFLLLFLIILQQKDTEKRKKDRLNKKNVNVLTIIPAYNEEKSIKNVVESIYKKANSCDVIVINDGSKDATFKRANETKATVIDLPNNLGIGGAVQTGYLYAYKNNYDIAIQVDADGQHDPKYINQMIEIIKNGQADMVIGSRFIEKTKYKQTFFRMLGIKITSGIIELLTDKKIYDTTSGFRAVNKEIIEIFADNYPYDYPEPCTNMEIILRGKEIKEIPVEMKQRETGVSSISPLKSVKYMLKVVLALLLMRIKKIGGKECS